MDTQPTYYYSFKLNDENSHWPIKLLNIPTCYCVIWDTIPIAGIPLSHMIVGYVLLRSYIPAVSLKPILAVLASDLLATVLETHTESYLTQPLNLAALYPHIYTHHMVSEHQKICSCILHKLSEASS